MEEKQVIKNERGRQNNWTQRGAGKQIKDTEEDYGRERRLSKMKKKLKNLQNIRKKKRKEEKLEQEEDS